jgi:two-component system, LytTR family, response regulator
MIGDVMRVLLVDDEPLARDRLRQLLRSFENLLVVGEAEDGEQAIERIIELRPDLLFLDIQMPGCSGLEVAASLPSPRPRVIFCTAFDQYAIDAFELHAVDYLLKPVTRARLGRAVEHARSLTPDNAEDTLNRVVHSDRLYPSRFLAKRGNKFRVVSQGEICYFESEEGLTKLCTREHEYWVQPTLANLETRLNPVFFFRLSRSSIVNLNEVLEVVPLTGGHGEVILKGGARLEVSRRRMKDLLDALEGPK